MRTLIIFSLLTFTFSLTTTSDSLQSQTSPSLSVTPQYFDLREIYYTSCDFRIYEEGACTGSWAITIADAISDVYCIKKKNPVVLSPQYIIDCVHRNDNTCRNSTKANLLKDSLTYIDAHGLITSSCYSYSSALTGKLGSACPHKCNNGSTISMIYPISSFKTLSNVEEIKTSILKSGSVIVNIQYYSDLLLYSQGLYTPKKDSTYLGYHTVKLVGWDLDDDENEYWIAANSFGINWGMGGYLIFGTDSDLIVEAYGISLD